MIRVHELYVAESLLNTVLDEARKAQATRILAINVNIGEFSGIEEDCIKFYFEILSKDTPALGAKLNISYKKAEFKCGACKKTFDRVGFRFACPFCGSYGLLTDQGGGLFLESIEVE